MSDLEFGIILGDVPTAVDPSTHLDGVLRQVEAAQRNGFTYVCIGQHFLYEGLRWLQPIPLLARLAGETNVNVKLAPTVMIVPFYHPVLLAEELATLDIVSEGRLVIGAGTGYRQAEFDFLGVPYEERNARLAESLELMTRLWNEDVITFEGRFWQLHEAPTHLHPIQRPRPPIWMGAMKPPGIRRAARLGDAWMIVPEAPFAEVERDLALYDEERRAHGLALPRLPIRREIVVGATTEDALDRYAARSAERYRAYAERGHPELVRHDFDAGFRAWALERAILGTPEQCIAQLHGLGPRFGPVIVRPSWPGMATEDVVAYLDDVGEKVVSAFRSRP
ncbi:MAG: LLM class flavin-dependent oxidoreductase [Actinobacteria bacterium]|nr:LLM class flavin-dependent oxidoreductase [Actinomycetota bacterium]